MKCAQCATEVTGAAQRCPQCGAGLTMEQSQQNFSYLPPGAPPWPETTSPSLSASQQPPLQQSSAPEIAQRRLKKPLILLALVILTPLLGSLATLGFLYGTGKASSTAANPVSQQLTTGATPATDTPFKTVKDTTLNLSLQYPADWTAGPLNQASEPADLPLKSPSQNGSAMIVIDLQHFSTRASTQINSANDLNAAYIQGLSQYSDLHNIQTISSAQPQPTIGGIPWSQQEATFQDKNNVQYHLIVITVQRNKSYYNINSIMKESIYQEAQKKYIQPILNSIRFLS
ncbi:hypothetical protein [Tengunoibacter tsumagoiensis]|uniref:PsbP C-terminal domain-containing protein n=1 Tax=Tengunoibacter tsumagoiensis TaxID=2014871 RepID=A0A402A4L6_9CHLR|nr:hypothetical protein [Tengunoibacter tsumagoiensis]GCE14050.1 hypothetical protein KTT_39090 [Tengunoibacter tsumagoiensis]